MIQSWLLHSKDLACTKRATWGRVGGSLRGEIASRVPRNWGGRRCLFLEGLFLFFIFLYGERVKALVIQIYWVGQKVHWDFHTILHKTQMFWPTQYYIFPSFLSSKRKPQASRNWTKWGGGDVWIKHVLSKSQGTSITRSGGRSSGLDPALPGQAKPAGPAQQCSSWRALPWPCRRNRCSNAETGAAAGNPHHPGACVTDSKFQS